MVHRNKMVWCAVGRVAALCVVMLGVDGSAGVVRCLQGGRRYRTLVELNPGQGQKIQALDCQVSNKY